MHLSHFIFFKYLHPLFISCIFLFFVTACNGKRDTIVNSNYGPLLATNPNNPFIKITNCVPGEEISCEAKFTYNTGVKSEISTGAICDGTGTIKLNFQFNCTLFLASSWTGSVECSSTKSRLVSVQPTALQNIQC